MFKTLTAIFLMVFAVSAFAGEHADRLNDWYKPDSWDGKDSKNKPGFKLGEFETKEYKGKEVENSPDNPSLRAFEKDGKKIFNSFVEVCKSAEEAHKKLLAFLGNVSHPDKIPSTAELELNIGHVGYVFSQNGKVQWIAFVRNNVLVVLMLTDTDADVDLAGIAEEIDSEIKDQKDVDSPTKPEIKSFEAEKSEIDADEKVGLSVDVDPKSGDDVDYHFEVKGEGQGYVEKGEDGKYYFKGTGKGKVTIVVTTTNSLCNQSKKEIVIEVK